MNGEFAVTELPGVAVNCWHVVFGAPGWPGPFGLVVAKAVPDIVRSSSVAALPRNKICIRMIPTWGCRYISLVQNLVRFFS